MGFHAAESQCGWNARLPSENIFNKNEKNQKSEFFDFSEIFHCFLVQKGLVLRFYAKNTFKITFLDRLNLALKVQELMVNWTWVLNDPTWNRPM